MQFAAIAEFVLWAGGAVWGLSKVSDSVKTIADSGKTAQEAASSLVKEVVIPCALIYGAYLYYQTRKKA